MGVDPRSINEWNTFYREIFPKLWNGMNMNGIFAINIHPAIYKRVLQPMFGDANTEMTHVLKKSSRNSYEELVYIWRKTVDCVAVADCAAST
jgi:hypothetical protein